MVQNALEKKERDVQSESISLSDERLEFLNILKEIQDFCSERRSVSKLLQQLKRSGGVSRLKIAKNDYVDKKLMHYRKLNKQKNDLADTRLMGGGRIHQY
jgi:hypothetical protein